MPELRRDPLIGRWVVIAADRAFRPSPPRSTVKSRAETCPFCPGQEAAATPEILAYRPAGSAANGPGWSVRVVPSRVRAVGVEGELDRSAEGLCDRMNAIGAHEVIIESPEHGKDLGELSADQVESVLWAYRERIQDLRRDLRLRSCHVFRSRGLGSPIDHGHSQLIALPVVPRTLADELATSRRHFEAHERCLLCDLLAQEKRDGARIVAENGHAIALAPFASRSPFEVWVLPLRHHSHFEELDRAAAHGIAELLRTTLRKLDLALEGAAYQMELHTAPLREPALAHYHWSLRIAPGLIPSTGAEPASGVAFNPVPPEEAAAFLRKLSA